MKDFRQFIQTTVKAVAEISPFPLSVSDANGYIIGDSNTDRIGTYHQPSRDVLKHNKPQLFDEDGIRHLDNVLPGVALPLAFNNETKGVLGIIGDPQDVLPHAQLIKRHVEVSWQDMLRIQTEDLETALMDALMQYLLFGEDYDQGKMERYCEILQINPSLKRYCLLIDIGDVLIQQVRKTSQLTEAARVRKTLLEIVSHVFSKSRHDLSAFLDTERIVLIKTVSSDTEYRDHMQQLEEWGQVLQQRFNALEITNVSVAAGGLYESLKNMAQSFQDAETLLRTANLIPQTSGIYSFYQQHTLTSLLPYEIEKNFQGKLDFLIQPLIHDKQFPELAHNFIAYCEHDLNLTQAAETLFLHRNTLIYRLRKIEKMTALDTSSFTDCMLLYLGLKGRDGEEKTTARKGQNKNNKHPPI